MLVYQKSSTKVEERFPKPVGCVGTCTFVASSNNRHIWPVILFVIRGVLDRTWAAAQGCVVNREGRVNVKDDHGFI